MKITKLICGLLLAQKKLGEQQILAIEFEDGSGYKFNVTYLDSSESGKITEKFFNFKNELDNEKL